MKRRIDFLMDREMRKFRFGWAIIYRDWDRVEIFKSQNAACERWDGYEVPCLTYPGVKDFLRTVKGPKKNYRKKRVQKHPGMERKRKRRIIVSTDTVCGNDPVKAGQSELSC